MVYGVVVKLDVVNAKKVLLYVVKLLGKDDCFVVVIRLQSCLLLSGL